MIYHLLNDEKVVNRAIEIFEKTFPGQNFFIVFKKGKFNYVRTGYNIISYKDYEPFKMLFKPTSVVIHYLTARKIKFVNKYIDSNIPVYWVMWGADLYDRMLMPKGYELFDTKSLFYKSIRIRRFFKSFLKIPNDKIRALRRSRFIKKRVKYLVTSTIEDDYQLFIKYYPQMKEKIAKNISYYPIDKVIGKELSSLSVTGNDIQIGNSGTKSNNHEYVLRILSAFDIRGRKIIIPLSYSAKKVYKDALLKKGHELFGDCLEPITSFMPLADYNHLMARSSVAIYGNWRQEAVGNVLVSLYLGAKVFLSKKNPMLVWALRHGFVVFELESMTQDALDTPLECPDKEHNRSILLQQFDSKSLYNNLKSIFTEK